MEVEIDHGHVQAKGAEKLPDKASGLLTIFPAAASPAALSPLQALEALQQHLHLHLDGVKAAEWMAAVHEARR